ncbi:MAG: hypothetical protein R3E89_00985 [Thiolinea sp.]
MMVKYVKHAGILLSAVFLASATLGVASADSGYTPYKIKMERIDPNREIRKSAIMSRVRELYPGRILSIREHTEGGPDCHIVKSMGDDGEFRIIHVACTKEF